MTYVLHGARGSGSCAVECVLAEIGADYELRELSLRDDEQRGEEYAAVNPHRKVPCLVIEDGPPLTDSVAILLTLDDRHPETALLPAKGAPARAQALRWLLFAATEIYPIVEINDYPERFATDPDQIDAMRERAREIWRRGGWSWKGTWPETRISRGRGSHSPTSTSRSSVDGRNRSTGVLPPFRRWNA